MSNQPFPGFPAKSSFTPLPDLFFSRLLPEIHSLAELRLVLHIFWRLSPKKEAPKFITYDELASDGTLMEGLDGTADASEVLRGALASAVGRSVLLHVVLEGQDVYFINDERSKAAVSKIRSGELPVHTLLQSQPCIGQEAPNIFTLYEQNIGLLNAMIAEELKEAERLYPAVWIEEAFREAATLNKRRWGYIARILERWSIEGKGSGKSGRDFKKKRGPERYLGGKYGHLVRH